MAETLCVYGFELSLPENEVDGKSVSIAVKPFQRFCLVCLLTGEGLERYFDFRLTELYLENQIVQGFDD